MTERIERKASNVVDFNDPSRNMYGCAPCPKCKSEYRASYTDSREAKVVIMCDDCGYTEEAINAG